jgi:CHAT domain-containing protein/predicted negative regulator of RcsB-dependent stress response
MAIFVAHLFLLAPYADAASATHSRKLILAVSAVTGDSCAFSVGDSLVGGILRGESEPGISRHAILAAGRVFEWSDIPAGGVSVEARDVASGARATLLFDDVGNLSSGSLPLYPDCSIEISISSNAALAKQEEVDDVLGTALLWSEASRNMEQGEKEASSSHYEEAIRIAGSSVAKWEVARISNSVEAARNAISLANWKVEAGDIKGAKKQLEGYLAQLRHMGGDSHLLTLEAEHILARVLAFEGRFTEAMAARERIEQLYAERGLSRHAGALKNHVALSGTLIDLGRLDAAREILSLALPLARDELGENHEVTIYALRQLASLESIANNTLAARDLLLQALKEMEAARGKSHRTSLHIRRSLAWLSYGIGQWDAALQMAESAYLVDVQAYGEESFTAQVSRDLLASMYWAVRRYEDAVTLEEKAYAGIVKLSAPDDRQRLRIASNLGEYYLNVHKPQRALPLIHEAYLGQLGKSGAGNRSTLYAQLQLGKAQLAAGDAGSACSTFEAIAEQSKEMQGALQRFLIELEHATARCRQDQGNYQAARKLYEALLGSRAHLSFEGAQSLAWRSEYAHVLIMQGEEQAALRELEHIVLRLEKRRTAVIQENETRMSEFSSWVTGDEYASGFHDLARIYLKQRKPERLVELVERTKARTLYELLEGRQDDALHALDGASREQWVALQARLRKSQAAAGRGVTSEEIAAVADVVGAAKEIAGLRDALARRFPRFAEIARTPVYDYRRARASIPKDTAYVHYLAGRQRVIGVVLTRTGKAEAHDLGDARILATWVNALNVLIGAGAEEAPPIWELSDTSMVQSVTRPTIDARRITNWEEVAAQLSAKLLQPFAIILSAKQRWTISPDGFLNTLPYEVLTWKGKPAVTTQTLAYSQSLTLRALQEKRHKTDVHRASGLLALGDPAYPRGSGWPRLAWSTEEVDRVSTLFPQSQRTLLSGAQARRDSLLELQRDGRLKRSRYVLFSAHAYAKPADPMRGAIVLAPDIDKPAEPGILTAAEVAMLDLNADLVVLSACETGAGRIQPGEGVVGLPYAFSAAGSRATVLTLWPVADRSTAQFIYSLMARVRKGKRFDTALAETKREFLNLGSRYQHPRYWAPFVLYGATSR